MWLRSHGEGRGDDPKRRIDSARETARCCARLPSRGLRTCGRTRGLCGVSDWKTVAGEPLGNILGVGAIALPRCEGRPLPRR